MDRTYIQSPNGTIYEYVFGEDTREQWPNVSESWFENNSVSEAPHAPYAQQSNGSERPEQFFTNYPASVAPHQSQSSEIGRPGQLFVNPPVSVEPHALEYQADLGADGSPSMKKKKKKEKERLCHITPKDVLYQCEQQFLRMVFDCPSIWNHKIDIKERHPETKAKKWILIKNDMVAYLQNIEANIDVSKIKVEMLKNTWNHIRENYVRYKNELHPPTGSGAKDIDPPEHSEVMRAYDDMMVKRKQVSSLEDEGDEADSQNQKAFYTPKSKKSKGDKFDSSDGLSPFIASATSFLSKLSDDSVKTTSIVTNPTEGALDKTVLFVNSIIPDLQKFDDEHFALIKMIIAKDIYDVLLKQIGKDQKQ